MVILVDNYDSFVYNLYQYIGEFDSDIRVYRNDDITGAEILALAPDRLIISPGPKTPREAGNCIDIIKEAEGRIPILGVCLGHQAIVEAFGGKVSNAKELFHGKSSLIKHNGKDIFEGLPNPLKVARYHSLSAVRESMPDCLEITAEVDGEIMAVRHKEHPIYGLQFHPESIYTPDGMNIIKNFMQNKE